MKNLKKILAMLCFASFLTLNPSNIYADIFNDVDINTVGYESIKKMSSLGLMVGDLQGNFKPNSYVSKFDAMKVLAKLAPNQDINISESKYNNIVLEYDKKYTRWDSSSNQSMVLLLENSVLKEEDLKDFVILDKDSKEQIRALSKEEICLYLTRIEQKEDEVNSLTFNEKFNDENNINKDKVNSCYYMNSLGIVTANDNNFYPKNAIAKGDFAVIIDKFLQYTNINIQSNTLKPLNIENNIQTRIVTISNVFIDNHSIQTKIGNESKVYNLSKDAKVYIDEISSPLSSLKPDINAEITIQDGLVTKIDAKTNLKIQDIQNDKDIKRYGIIKNISDNSIGLSYKELDEDSFNLKEKIDVIPLSANCKITKNGITTNTIEENSIATVVLDNKMATQIILEDDNAIFIGNIIDKTNEKITIKTTDGKILELAFMENANITRNDIKASIKDLKIGDTVNITTKKDKILSLKAKGTISKKQGTVKSINISKKYSIIEIEDNNKSINSYYINNLTTDVYSLKVLDTVDLYLDSYEVYAVDILERKHNKSFSGEVLEINKDYIIVSNNNLAQNKVFIDKDTIFFDYESLKNVSYDSLKKGDNVYVVFKDNTQNIASNINIVFKK